ncbi:hypothetical protein [Sphingobacterium anhuiense]|nr:hypothetical protein EDF66_105277 [Sphingobacterium sp. JUb20]
MHPFRNKNRNHSIMNENKDSKKPNAHPFVRSNFHLLDKDTKSHNMLKIQQVPIVNEETLEQVIFEMNLMKNKN